MKSFSELFIQKPVATTLLTIAMALSGGLAFFLLPVAPLPQVDFPTIMVSASLPGASPETMASSVATPLERALGRISGVTEMTSSSSLGLSQVTLQFDLNRPIDGAAKDVQAAIQAARSMLPTDMPSTPTYRKVNPADAPIMVLTLTSKTMPKPELYNVASTILVQKLCQISGVGQVTVGGSSLPAVRVELNPMIMSQHHLSFEDIRKAITEANVSPPKGMIETQDHAWRILANDQAKTAAEYKDLVVRYINNAPIRLSQVAKVLDSVEDVRNAGIANGSDAVLLIVRREPGSNIIETVDRITAALPQLQASIPVEVDLKVVMDRTPSIRASLADVEWTLLVSIALVVMVVFLFLGHGRATLIPAIVLPVSLAGTFGVMYLCDFSLNNLSLMALTIATGFVVDDAIVVLEAIEKRLEQGMSPLQASICGARDVWFTVISMSISLIAVFIPILMMGGIVGRLFREFAITLSVAIVVSLIVSLTTTPMLCSQWLRHETKVSRWGKISLQGFQWLAEKYHHSLRRVLKHPNITLVILGVTMGLNIFLYIVIPKGFFPQQDTGRIIGSIQADQSISFQAMEKKLSYFIQKAMQDRTVDQVVGFTGNGQRNTGTMFLALTPFEKRKEPMERVMARLRQSFKEIPGATLVMQPIQDLRVGGRSSSALYQFTLMSDDLKVLRAWTPQVYNAMMALPQLVDVNTDAQEKGLQTTLKIHRDAAARLGLTMRAIDDTLNTAFGQRQVSTIWQMRNQYHVVLEAAPSYLQNPETLKHLFVTNTQGLQVPLSAFASYESTYAPLVVNHQSQFAASTISFNLAPGVALSQASEAITQMMQTLNVPHQVHGTFRGTALAFQESLKNQPWLILSALVAIYIVLGILYESTLHPLTILSTLPSAGVGSLAALMFCRTDFSILALIGVILLIGIVKKNAIMMIDVAITLQRDKKLSPPHAIFQACLLRFRPIMMTTAAAFMGALPMALGLGEGGEFRQPLGIAIVGGLIMSQVLTLYTTPVVYLALENLSKKRGGGGK